MPRFLCTMESVQRIGPHCDLFGGLPWLLSGTRRPPTPPPEEVVEIVTLPVVERRAAAGDEDISQNTTAATMLATAKVFRVKDSARTNTTTATASESLFTPTTQSLPPNTARTQAESLPPNTARTQAESLPPNTAKTQAESLPPNTARTKAEPLPPNTARTQAESLPPNTARTQAESLPPNTARTQEDVVLPNTVSKQEDLVLPNTANTRENLVPPNTARTRADLVPNSWEPILEKYGVQRVITEHKTTDGKLCEEPVPPNTAMTLTESSPPKTARTQTEACTPHDSAALTPALSASSTPTNTLTPRTPKRTRFIESTSSQDTSLTLPKVSSSDALSMNLTSVTEDAAVAHGDVSPGTVCLPNSVGAAAEEQSQPQQFCSDFAQSRRQQCRQGPTEKQQQQQAAQQLSMQQQQEKIFWMSKVNTARWMGVNKNLAAVPLMVREAPDFLKADEDFMMQAVTHNGDALQFADARIKSNEAVVRAAILLDGYALKYAHDSLRAREDFILEALQQQGFVLVGANSVKDMFLRVLPDDGMLLELAPCTLREDPEVVLIAVKSNGTALEFACNHLKAHSGIMSEALTSLGYRVEGKQTIRDMVRMALWYDGMLLRLVDDSLRRDHEIALVAVRSNGYALQYVDEELAHDVELVHAAAEHDDLVSFLHTAPDCIRCNRSFILAAVNRNGDVLKYVSESLRDDREVVSMAVKKRGRLLQHASDRLKADSSIVAEAMLQDPDAFKHADARVRADRNVVLDAVTHSQSMIRFADQSLRADQEVMQIVVAKDGLLLKHAHPNLRADYDVVLAAVTNNSAALKYAHHSMRADRTIVLAAVEQNGLALKYASEELQADYDIVFAAGAVNEQAFMHAQGSIKNDSNIERFQWMNKLEEVSDVYGLVKNAPIRLKSDRSFMMAAIKRDGEAIRHADTHLKVDHEVEIASWMSKVAKSWEGSSLHVTARHKLLLASAPAHIRTNPDFLFQAMLGVMRRLSMKPESLGLTGNESGREGVREGVLKVVRASGLLLEIAGEPYSNDVEVVVAAVRNDWRALQFASAELRNSPNIVLEAVTGNGLALKFASHAVAGHYNLVYRAVSHNGEALEFASEELKQHKEFVIAAISNAPLALQHAAEHMRLDLDVQEVLRAVSSGHTGKGKKNVPLSSIRPIRPIRPSANTNNNFDPTLLLSLRWRSMHKSCSSLALDFDCALGQHWYLKKLEVRDLNDGGRARTMCGPEANCRGTSETCKMEAERAAEKKKMEADARAFIEAGRLPAETQSQMLRKLSRESKEGTGTCWRVKVRKLMESIADALLVLEESDGLSSEQSLQLEMAQQLNVKVFKVVAEDKVFEGEKMWMLGCLVHDWNRANRADLSPATVLLSSSL